MATKAFQKIYTKITQITKATCSLKATGVAVSYTHLTLPTIRLV